MQPVYLGKFHNFTDAINGIVFETRVPEYYDPHVPDYYKFAHRNDRPIVNGEPVSWEEYRQLYPDSDVQETSFIPQMIYKAGDMNMCCSYLTIPYLMDLSESNVPYSFVRLNDVALVIDLIDGYVNEFQEYTGRSVKLKTFIDRLRQFRMKLIELNNEITVVQERRDPSLRKPFTFTDLLKKMSGGE